MIGIIGPTDSVIRAKSVASGLGLADLVLLRTYVTWDTVPQLAAELDPACTVLLFTGRVPYTIARNRGGLQAALDFIPHDGADLFRALIRVLRDNAGRLPPASLDTIDRSAVEETYLDLDLQPPSALLTLDEAVRAPGEWRASDVTVFHEDRYRRGEVELCLTCMGPVHDELGRRGVPVVRVDHTRAALREALRRASLTDRLARTEASQIAVAVVDVRDDGRRGPRPDRYEAQRDELRLRSRVLDLAERLQGTLGRSSDGSYLVHTTRGAVTAELSALDQQGDDGLGSGDSLSIGYGVGATVARAEENARQAAAIGRQTGNRQIVLDDGTVLAFGDRGLPQRYRLREVDPALIAHARSVGLGPLTLARLVTALAKLDPSAVTARDLAAAYGVAPRSALRMLSTLERSGIAVALGIRSAPRAGRPQTVYRVHIDRLLQRAEGGAGS